MTDRQQCSDILGNAITRLITGRGRIKDRLIEACDAGLARLDPAAFDDDEARRLVLWLKNRLFATGQPIGTVIGSLDESEAVRIAEVIDSLDVAASLQIISADID